MQSRPFNIAQTLQEALSLHQQGRLRDAEKLYARALKAAPNNFDALHLLGLIKAQSGQMGEAHRLMAAALKINPNAPDALVNFANVLHALKRDGEALTYLDKALALRPGDQEALLYRGNALNALDRPEDAIACYDAVLARNPAHGDALLNRGTARARLGRHADALTDFDAVLTRIPHHVEALYNRGTALLELERPDAALAAFDAAVAAAPKHTGAWTNRGRALQALNRHADAVASFEKAIAVDKNFADAHSNMALSLLTLGQLSRGFAEYEWRWKRTGMSDARRNYRGRPWLGEFPIGQRTILLAAEQGLGDSIQFVRHAPLLARSGAKVVLEVQPELKALLAGVDGVALCHARGETLPAYDVYCPLGSLPLAFKTEPATIPADIPYLRADETHVAKWRPTIEALPGKRVALAWAGHAKHPNDRNRSIALAQLEPLLALDGISFVSVQRDLRGDDEVILARHKSVTHIGDKLDDMADTAAVLALADLTIAVDTSVIHLAGAMGREAWVMLPFSPDWRWTLTGDHSPWYPRMRLFRQAKPGDWSGVIASLRDALRVAPG
ncbi:MAG TPA: tetratricopeptide repeat protein [Burkholderiales bacterium]|nr:tetratricopeptide repeat protein [Burkholderiales bacterium]